MKFTQAASLSNKIKRKDWQGYWEMIEVNAKIKIMMHCADGNVLEVRETDDILFTLGNVCADDWEVI